MSLNNYVKETKHFSYHGSRALLFQDPCTILLAGSTGSGKTHFVSRLLYEDMFENVPKCIHYCYGAYQKKFDEMSSKCQNIQFHHGLPRQKDLEFGVLCCLTTPGLRKDIRRQIRQLYSHKVTYYVHYNYMLSSHLLSHSRFYFYY